MKHFGLKLNHAIEIGAHLAYVGHFKRTNDFRIQQIAMEEVEHRRAVEQMLFKLGERPSKFLNTVFKLIGHTVGALCQVFPLWSLNYVARTLELFAVFSYSGLAVLYPEFRIHLEMMAKAEERHRLYFGGAKTLKGTVIPDDAFDHYPFKGKSDEK